MEKDLTQKPSADDTKPTGTTPRGPDGKFVSTTSVDPAHPPAIDYANDPFFAALADDPMIAQASGDPGAGGDPVASKDPVADPAPADEPAADPAAADGEEEQIASPESPAQGAPQGEDFDTAFAVVLRKLAAEDPEAAVALARKMAGNTDPAEAQPKVVAPDMGAAKARYTELMSQGREFEAIHELVQSAVTPVKESLDAREKAQERQIRRAKEFAVFAKQNPDWQKYEDAMASELAALQAEIGVEAASRVPLGKILAMARGAGVPAAAKATAAQVVQSKKRAAAAAAAPVVSTRPAVTPSSAKPKASAEQDTINSTVTSILQQRRKLERLFG